MALLRQVGLGRPMTRTEFDENMNEFPNKFANIAALKAATWLQVGQVVAVEEYHSGVGGGMLLGRIVAGGTGTDDGGSYIDLAASGLQFKQNFPQTVTPKHFGAKGDGITDDTQSVKTAMFHDSIFDTAGTEYLVSEEVFIPTGKTIKNIELKYKPDLLKPIVIAATGQSNMRGINGVGGTFKINSNVKVWCSTTQLGSLDFREVDLENNTYWQPAQTTSSSFGGGSNNLAVAFCHRIQELTGRPVYLVMDSMGSTPISSWLNNGVRTQVLDAAIVAGLSALGLSNIDAFLWHQGENDAANTNYVSDFETLISDYRSRSWMLFNTPVVAGLLTTTNATYNDQNNRIYRISLNENDAWGNLKTADRYMNVADSHGLSVVDGVHFDGDSLFELGYYRYVEGLVKIGSMFPYLVNIRNNGVSIDRIQLDCNMGCNGYLIQDIERCKIHDSDVTKFIENGITTRIKAGQLKIESPNTYQHSFGDPLFNTRSGRSGIGINWQTADGHLINPVSYYCWCPIRFSGFYNVQVEGMHPFNGQTDGSVVDAINVIIEADAYHIESTNNYIDKGRVVIHNPESRILGGLVAQGNGESNSCNFELVSHGTLVDWAELSINDLLVAVGGTVTDTVKFTDFINNTHAPVDGQKFNWSNITSTTGVPLYKLYQNSKVSIDTSGNIAVKGNGVTYISTATTDIKSSRSLRYSADFNNNAGANDSKHVFSANGTDIMEITEDSWIRPIVNAQGQLGDFGKVWESNWVERVVFSPTSVPATLAPYRQMFVDAADDTLKYKDGSGVVKIVSLV